MRVINLSSGSDGNLTYVETENSRILVDVGLSCKETLARLSLLGVDGKDIDGILVTHEHSDHIKGIDTFSKKFGTPVFAHQEVWGGLWDKLKSVDEKNKKIYTGDFALKDIIARPVEVPHDVKCFGYSLCEGDKKVSIITDLGHMTDEIMKNMQGSQLVYLEANHDVNMLKNCEKYPLTLKLRIAGPRGHLSNDDSAKAIESLVQSGTRQIVLSHLSRENNSPNLAYTYICEKLKENELIEGEMFKIDVATTRPTTLFKIK